MTRTRPAAVPTPDTDKFTAIPAVITFRNGTVPSQTVFPSAAWAPSSLRQPWLQGSVASSGRAHLHSILPLVAELG